jgi:hypothetical protein
MTWSKKLKSMFVVSDAPAETAAEVMRELEKYELPPDVPGDGAAGAATALPLPPGAAAAALPSAGGAIDFQSLYDQAGIPNTDEVEALERFLAGLDASLPDAAKVAAARAFLGAIGKAPKDVIADSGRKIQVVRTIADAKRADTEKAIGERQAAIAELQRQMDEQRAAIQGLERELESVRSLCAIEESRLQGARMFFGYVGESAGAGGPASTPGRG